MAFTYLGDLSTDLDKVRFNIGDTVASSGPKPASGNFTDAELGGLITSEGSWEKATAALKTVLEKYPQGEYTRRAAELLDSLAARNEF